VFNFYTQEAHETHTAVCAVGTAVKQKKRNRGFTSGFASHRLQKLYIC